MRCYKTSFSQQFMTTEVKCHQSVVNEVAYYCFLGIRMSAADFRQAGRVACFRTPNKSVQALST